MMSRVRKYAIAASVVSALGSQTSVAQTNLVTNGTFAVTGGSQSFRFTTSSGYVPAVSSTESLAAWSGAAGCDSVFIAGSPTTEYNLTYMASLYNSTNSSNGFNMLSPTGGNFVAIDSYSSYAGNPLSETITGLTSGATYSLTFSWAGANLDSATYSGGTQTYTPTTSQQDFQVTLGSQSHTTATVSVAQEGFSGWMTQTFSFVASSTSETLSFLANVTDPGNSDGPVTLLSNVSLTRVPEPGGLAIVATGLLGLLPLRRRMARPAA